MAKKENYDKEKRYHRHYKKGYTGVFLVIVGVVFLLNNFGYVSVDIGKLWPIFIVIFGLFMLMEYKHREK